jgi:hypothetical protein
MLLLSGGAESHAVQVGHLALGPKAGAYRCRKESRVAGEVANWMKSGMPGKSGLFLANRRNLYTTGLPVMPSGSIPAHVMRVAGVTI